MSETIEPDLEAAARLLLRQYEALERVRDDDDVRDEVKVGLKQTLVGGLRLYSVLVGVGWGVETILDHARMVVEEGSDNQ